MFCYPFPIQFALIQLFVFFCFLLFYLILFKKFIVLGFQFLVLLGNVLELQSPCIMVVMFKIFLIFIRRAKRVDSDVPFTFGEHRDVTANTTADIAEMSWEVIIVMSIGKFLESEFLILCEFFMSLFVHVFKIIIILNEFLKYQLFIIILIEWF